MKCHTESHASGFFSQTKNLERYFENICLKSGDTAVFNHMKEDGFYYIQSGMVKLYANTSKPQLLNIYKSGDIVGFGSWLPNGAFSCYITAIHETTLQFWSKKSFYELRSENSVVNDIIIDHLIESSHMKDKHIALLETPSAEIRLANLLYCLIEKFGVPCAEGVLLDIDLDRESFAQMAGTTTVTVARMITHFEKQNVLKRLKRKLIILNTNKIQDYLAV